MVDSIASLMQRIKYGSMVDESKNRTGIMDLNSDCLLQMCEELEFADLLNLAQVNRYMASLTAKIYQRKFSSKTIIFVSSRGKRIENFTFKALARIGLAERKKQLWIDDDFHIKVASFWQAMKIIKFFGNGIKKLEIKDYDTGSKQSKSIGRLINQHCFESLKTFAIEMSHGKALMYMEKPFENVEHVSLDGYKLDVDKKTPLNRTFPSLRKLSLTFTYVTSQNIVQFLPHLEHLYINTIVLTVLNEFLQINPHIKIMEFFQNSIQNLNSTSVLLPQLEHLILWRFGMSNGKIVFASVTKLSLMDRTASPKGIYFPKLTDLKMHFVNFRFGDWIDFLQEHEQLRWIDLEYSNMNDEQFEKLAMNLPNIMGLSVERESGQCISTNTIIRFIESHRKLVQLNLCRCGQIDWEILRNQLQNEWQITGHGVSLKLKRFTQ